MVFKMLRNVIGSTTLLSAAAITAKDAAPKAEQKAEPINEPTKIRPLELPIYTTIYKKQIEPQIVAEANVVYDTIESGVSEVRKFGCECVNAVKSKKKPIDDFVSTGIEHSQFAFDYLNEPANGIYRTGAIAVGALSGYIIAIRRGFIRRLLYTSVGGLGVASICYPKEAEQYWQQGLVESKTYATILYNFAYGVKPGDEPKPLPNVSVPNFKQIYDSVASYFKSDSK